MMSFLDFSLHCFGFENTSDSLCMSQTNYAKRFTALWQFQPFISVVLSYLCLQGWVTISCQLERNKKPNKFKIKSSKQQKCLEYKKPSGPKKPAKQGLKWQGTFG